LYIEMKDGRVFHVSVMECEKEDWPVHLQPLI
jgi:hypothetical protein